MDDLGRLLVYILEGVVIMVGLNETLKKGTVLEKVCNEKGLLPIFHT